MTSNSSSSSLPFFHQNRYTLTTLLLLVLSLLTIFLFSERSLHPFFSISLYQDSFPHSHTQNPLLQSPTTNENASSSSLQHKNSNVEVSDNDDKDPFAQNPVLLEPKNRNSEVADNDGKVPFAQNPVLQSPTTNSNASLSSSKPKNSNGEVSDNDDKDPFAQSETFRDADLSSKNGSVESEAQSNNKSEVDFVEDDDDVLVKESLRECDLYSGNWVKDEGYPLYNPGSCPYVDEAFDCQINGRPDNDYLKWRWKPHACHLPRFNATDFLVKLRGKRLMLVGDSMNRNQFESILCLLREGLSNKSRMYEIYGHKITKGRGYYVFEFEDYNCTVEFVRSHFLVKEGTRINGQGNSNPTLSIDQIDKTAKRWKRADILVFNTGHWWTHGKTARGKNYYKEGDYIYPKFDAVEAYRRALRTWAKWIDENIEPSKQLIFYRGYSSAHFRGGDWDSGGTCKGESQPILSGAILDNYPLKMKIVEEVIQRMQVPVSLLNVTRLTNFRKDGHPSIYGKSMTDAKPVSSRRQDCSHWCLPGVPDAWNELIYANLIIHHHSLKNYRQ